jgi:hypothetical protein
VNPNEIDVVRRKLSELARQILDGELSYIEGARSIWRLGRKGNLSEMDTDLVKFLAIDSETDALPIGAERKLWNRDALERLRPEIENAEAWAKKVGQTACENLVKRFGGSPMLYSADIITLWRPVGPQELELIRQSGMRAFPSRLPDQPIFYPVLTEEYAVKIARDWNVPASGSGFVTRFAVRRDYLSRFEVQDAGGRSHQEYWIPAEHLDAFNAAIVGEIEVVASFP